jgi:hypothetical protein
MQQGPKPAAYPPLNMEPAGDAKGSSPLADGTSQRNTGLSRDQFPEDLENPYSHPAGYDKVFGDQRGLNIQWVLLIFWQLVIPCIVACFLPLCQTPRFPTRSYYRGWVANMVMACVMVAVYIIIIAAASASAHAYYYDPYWGRYHY